MNRARFSVFLIAMLFGLLALLATLQYRWLGQISESEREKLEKRLQNDTEHFAEDFNREIQAAYYSFQIPSNNWKEKNWTLFNQRLETWQKQNFYPGLIKNFYFTDIRDGQKTYQYDFAKSSFELIDSKEKSEFLQHTLSENIDTAAIDESVPALLLPIHDTEKSNFIFIRDTPAEGLPPIRNLPRIGTFVIELDRDIITRKILPDLTKKYFSLDANAEFKIAVSSQNGNLVYPTQPVDYSDIKVKFFDLTAGNFIISLNQEVSGNPGNRSHNVLVNRIFEKKDIKQKTPSLKTSETKITSDQNQQVSVLDNQNIPDTEKQKGIWTLSVQHTDGSLAQFLSRTRRQSLIISFGILLLLGGSIILIFSLARRTQILAQRQMEFVSSVSHEFRTPLSVIYSAGENLADGIAKENTQVSRYGNLIKGEGKKLSAMVEQILDFAGANSGRKKYDWREQDLPAIIENAVGECQPLLREKNFVIEQDLPSDLPNITADKNALSRALQNLIVNSVKYSNDKKYLKITAQNGGGAVKITIEDQGLGISPDDLKHIFEPFYRAKSVVDEQIHGNGLGLSLVKKTIEAHGGKINVESKLGQGSKFTLSLPLNFSRK